jgi:hypothetical protein
MPYPNSQTPVTIRLNDLFCDRQALLNKGALRDLKDKSLSFADIATDAKYLVAQGPFGRAHVAAWPSDQQALARCAMILALEKQISIWFDWQSDSSTSIEVVLFTNAIGMTFKSPLHYPPFWGP